MKLPIVSAAFRRKYGRNGDTRLVRREDGQVEYWRGDHLAGIYGALPSPAECGAFGGSCEC